MVTAADILNASILVVDDQAVNVALLEGLLGHAGYTAIASTTDPHAVCALHRENGYDLILLDLQMPDLDGFQVMDGLKKIEQDGYLPVLVITAQPGHKLRALESGARDFISKPFDVAEVLTRVRNMLEVRLLHARMKHAAALLAETVREVEASREVIRQQSAEVRALYDQVVTEQRLSERLLLNALPDVITVRPDEEIRHLVPAFLADCAREADALRGALATPDFHAIGLIGHALKETGRGYGFDGLTEIGSAIERAAHHGDTAAIGTRITHLTEYLDRVQIAGASDAPGARSRIKPFPPQ